MTDQFRKDLLTVAESLLDKGSSVLDIGAGTGYATDYFLSCGHNVTSITLRDSDEINDSAAHLVGDYCGIGSFLEDKDAIWASHVLEHALNMNMFIKKMYSDLKRGGWLFVIVPPMKSQIVGGHVNLFNEGLLLYNLILGGFDCEDAYVIRMGYNIAVFVRKVGTLHEDLPCEVDHIGALSHYFPPAAKARQGFEGDNIVNWPPKK